MLPGFEPIRPGENKIEQAAVYQLEKLRAAGMLADDHAILAQVVLALASSVGDTMSTGKLTVAGVSGAKLLLDAIEQLPISMSDDGMGALVSELRAVS